MKICKTSNTWIEGKRTVEKKDLSVRENRELEFSIYPFFYLSIKNLNPHVAGWVVTFEVVNG